LLEHDPVVHVIQILETVLGVGGVSGEVVENVLDALLQLLKGCHFPSANLVGVVHAVIRRRCAVLLSREEDFGANAGHVGWSAESGWKW